LKIPDFAGRKFPTQRLVVVDGFQPVATEWKPAGEAAAGSGGDRPAKE
jgi:hypothetical protein